MAKNSGIKKLGIMIFLINYLKIMKDTKINIIKYSYILVLILFGVVLSNCSQKKKQIDNNKILHEMHDSISILKDKVISGDTIAYLKLRKVFNSYYEYPHEFYLYALIMANDYHYPASYFDVYYHLLGIYDGDFNKMDKDSKALAIFHLKKGAKLNNESCKAELRKLNLD